MDISWLSEKYEPSFIVLFNDLIDIFNQPFADILVMFNFFGNKIETFAVIMAIIGVILQARHNIWGWAFLAVASMFFPFVLFNNYALLGDSIMWGFTSLWILCSAIWGWLYWLNNRLSILQESSNIGYSYKEIVKRSHLADFTLSPETFDDDIKFKVRYLDAGVLFLIIPFVLMCCYFFGWFLENVLGAIFPYSLALPYWDGASTVLVITAQILLIGKFWEAWPAWFIASFLSMVIYSHKGAWSMVAFYSVILVISVISTVTWYRRYKQQKLKRWALGNN